MNLMNEQMTNNWRSERRLACFGALLGMTFLLIAILGGSVARAAVGPLYDVKATWGDTYLSPGGKGQFVIQGRNVGDALLEEDLIITDELPAGVTVTNIKFDEFGGFLCSGIGTNTATCFVPGFLVPFLNPPSDPLANGSKGYLPTMYVDVEIDSGAPAAATNTATIVGGGDPEPFSDVEQVQFGANPPTYNLVQGSFEADFFDDAYPFGDPARQASDRPSELRVNFDIGAKTGVNDGSFFGDTSRYVLSTGQLKTVEVTLPRGFVGNPEATPKCDPLDFADTGGVRILDPLPHEHPGRLPERPNYRRYA
jgi:hypothetical protein